MDKDPVLGAVGALQFEVLQHRLRAEYGVEVRIDRLPYTQSRWIVNKLDFFNGREDSKLLVDRDQFPLVLFKSE